MKIKIAFYSSILVFSSVNSGKNILISKNALQNYFDWNRGYLGLNVGGNFNKAKVQSNHLGFVNSYEDYSTTKNFSNFFPGIQFGFMQKFRYNTLLGIEGNLTYNVSPNYSFTYFCSPNQNVYDYYSINNKIQGSLLGRLGYLLNPKNVAFVAAGGNVSNVSMSYHHEVGDFYSKNSTKYGWQIGAGLEISLLENLTIRGEYYYADYGNFNMRIPSIYGLTDPNGKAHVNLTSNNVRLAISKWF